MIDKPVPEPIKRAKRGLELKARTVKLSDETVERAKALGAGNLSEGIRRALSLAANAEADPQRV